MTNEFFDPIVLAHIDGPLGLEDTRPLTILRNTGGIAYAMEFPRGPFRSIAQHAQPIVKTIDPAQSIIRKVQQPFSINHNATNGIRTLL